MHRQEIREFIGPIRQFFCTNSPRHAFARIGILALILMMALPTTLLVSSAALAQTDISSAASPVTTITVDTSQDLTPGSTTTTCTFDTTQLNPALDGCTLRRAILEAAARPPVDRPIAIVFNLSSSDPNKDLEVAGTWTLPIDGALPPLETDSILDINGQVTIDGDTQPGGRSNGPKIILDTNENSLEIESTNNTITNLAFKGGGVIFLKEDGNTVTNIWMGLSDNGQSIVFRNPSDKSKMAGGGIHISSDDNVVTDNVITGTYAKAVDISGGDNNLIEGNYIGTRADGTVPSVPAPALCLRNLNYDPQNWYGGWGIALSGSSNTVRNNLIAGLHIMQSANDTPPRAIEIFGADHIITGNAIGLDSAMNKIGVCGQGIKVSGSGTQIIANTIVRSRADSEDAEETAIMASDTSPLFGQIAVQRNIVEDGPGKIYEFGPGIPQILKTFNSAKITGIDGKNVSGTNGDGSPCPGCRIDFYRDDADETAEALTHLGNTTADGSGDFVFVMSSALPAGSGIRTMSTTQSAGVVGSYLAGTTMAESILYLPMGGVTVDGPTTGMVGTSYEFDINVSPTTATAPFDYEVESTENTKLTHSTTSTGVVATLSWDSPGEKTVNVSVTNDLGTLTTAHKITIAAVEDDDEGVYLPLLTK